MTKNKVELFGKKTFDREKYNQIKVDYNRYECIIYTLLTLLSISLLIVLYLL